MSDILLGPPKFRRGSAIAEGPPRDAQTVSRNLARTWKGL